MYGTFSFFDADTFVFFLFCICFVLEMSRTRPPPPLDLLSWRHLDILLGGWQDKSPKNIWNNWLWRLRSRVRHLRDIQCMSESCFKKCFVSWELWEEIYSYWFERKKTPQAHLLSSCPWPGTSGSDSIGSGSSGACRSGTPSCLDTCRWGLFGRSSWRSLCILTAVHTVVLPCGDRDHHIKFYSSLSIEPHCTSGSQCGLDIYICLESGLDDNNNPMKNPLNTKTIELKKNLARRKSDRQNAWPWNPCVIFPPLICVMLFMWEWKCKMSYFLTLTWGAVPADGTDVLGHPPGAGTLVVDVPQVLQPRRRLDVLRAADAVHRVHLRMPGRERQRQRLKLSERSRGGSAGEVRSVSRRQVSWYCLSSSIFSVCRLCAHIIIFSPHPHTFIVKVSQGAITCSRSGRSWVCRVTLVRQVSRCLLTGRGVGSHVCRECSSRARTAEGAPA